MKNAVTNPPPPLRLYRFLWGRKQGVGVMCQKQVPHLNELLLIFKCFAAFSLPFSKRAWGPRPANETAHLAACSN